MIEGSLYWDDIPESEKRLTEAPYARTRSGYGRRGWLVIE